METPCRICFESGGDLIVPCKCNGHSKYVHRECLETWRTFALNNNTCEICNVEYKFKSTSNVSEGCFCVSFVLLDLFYLLSIIVIISCVLGLCISLFTPEYENFTNSVLYPGYVAFSYLISVVFVIIMFLVGAFKSPPNDIDTYKQNENAIFVISQLLIICAIILYVVKKIPVYSARAKAKCSIIIDLV